VRPLKQQQQQSGDPVVLLHGFDRCVYLQCLASVSIIVHRVLLQSVMLYLCRALSGLDRSFKIIGCSSCLEWRYTYPLLEEAGLEAWAVDILGWGFSNLGMPSHICCMSLELLQ
jgi:hypothetical protein